MIVKESGQWITVGRVVCAMISQCHERISRLARYLPKGRPYNAVRELVEFLVNDKEWLFDKNLRARFDIRSGKDTKSFTGRRFDLKECSFGNSDGGGSYGGCQKGMIHFPQEEWASKLTISVRHEVTIARTRLRFCLP